MNKRPLLIEVAHKMIIRYSFTVAESPPTGGQTAFVLNKHLSDCRLTAKDLGATLGSPLCATEITVDITA